MINLYRSEEHLIEKKPEKDFEEMAKKNSELEEVYDVLDKVSADEKEGG